jgi:hypothetical protein
MTIGKKFVAPALPIPNVEYDQREQTDLIRALRLYFNLNDKYTTNVILDALNGGVGGNGITFPHIAASDSTDQYAGGNNTPTVVGWNTLDSGFLWTLNAPGSATAAVAGVYKITFRLQFVNTANAVHDAVVWLKVNNTDVPNSATAFSIPARKSAGVPSYLAGYSEITFEVQVGDDIELYWATDQAYNPVGPVDGVYILHDAAQTVPYARPATPSAIGSITYVSALPPP